MNVPLGPACARFYEQYGPMPESDVEALRASRRIVFRATYLGMHEIDPVVDCLVRANPDCPVCEGSR